MGWFLMFMTLLSAAASFLLLESAVRVESAVKSGRVKIELAEDITGPSYQIAAGYVVGSVLAVCAMVFAAIALSYVGTRS